MSSVSAGSTEGYALKGGGDAEFFVRLSKSGGRIVWSDEAVVEGVAPALSHAIEMAPATRIFGRDHRCWSSGS